MPSRGALCGADGWVQIAEFGRAKQAWLERFLELPNGIPTHDTFGRVFSLIDPGVFEACFRAWMETRWVILPGEVIAIDGKTLRRSHDRSNCLRALHLASAWAADNRLVLGQVATAAKSNEITAIPKLLDLLLIQGWAERTRYPSSSAPNDGHRYALPILRVRSFLEITLAASVVQAAKAALTCLFEEAGDVNGQFLGA